VAAGFLVPVIPYAGLPLAAFALGWLTYRFGPGPATVLALATSACVAILGPALLGTAVLDALFVAVSLLAVGPVTAVALRHRSALAIAGGTAVVITMAFMAAPIGAQMLKDSLVTWRGFLTALSANGSVSNSAALKTAISNSLTQMTATWPAASLYTMGIGTAIGVPLVARAGRSLGIPVKGYGPLADVDMSFHLVWPAILGLGLTALGAFWHQAPALVNTVGENVLMIVRPVLFLQGAAVFAALYKRMGAGRVLKVVGLVLLVATEVFVPSVSILGGVDLFANLRKLPRAEAHGTSA
jgi:uncharacterized protein YybS (DUF2232 family)